MIFRLPMTITLACIIAFTAVISGCRESGLAAERDPIELEGRTMGTSWKIAVIAPHAEPEILRHDITELLEDLESKFSHYRNDSEISRFNQAPAGAAIEVSRETVMLVSFAEEMRKTSAGAFDIRIARAVARDGFGPDSLAGHAQTQPIVNGTVVVTPDPPTLTKSHPDLAIDLSAFAKGYAVDRVADLLDENDIPHYLVEIGGELKAKGVTARGRPWTVGIESPIPGGRMLHLGVSLDNMAIATSGNYRLYRKLADGGLRSHLIDPRHDEPQRQARFRSVSVMLSNAMNADAWATALFVLGETRGKLLAEQEHIPACFLRIDKNGDIVETFAAGFGQSVFQPPHTRK